MATQISSLPGYCPYCLSKINQPIKINTNLTCSNGHNVYFHFNPTKYTITLELNEPLSDDWCIIEL